MQHTVTRNVFTLSDDYTRGLGFMELFTVSTVLSACSAHLRIWVEFKNVGWTKVKFYLYQNEEWIILNKKKVYFH